MSGPGINFDGYCSGQVSVTPNAILASTSSEVSVTMPGLLTTDIVLQFIKPTLTAGIDIGNFRISAANTLRVTYQNSTTATITPPTETYSYYVCRPQNALGGPDALSGGVVIFK